jgi:hypothetical protein
MWKKKQASEQGVGEEQMNERHCHSQVKRKTRKEKKKKKRRASKAWAKNATVTAR